MRILEEYLATEATEVTETSLRRYSFRNKDFRIKLYTNCYTSPIFFPNF